MATEEDVVFRINYQLEGVERSISTSRRALFTLNAIRLSIRDIQQVLSGPTIANVLFTAIQLTRTLTQARRLTKALAAESAASGVASVLGAVGGRGAALGGGRALGAGQLTLQSALLVGPRAAPPSLGFLASLVAAFTPLNLIAAGLVGATIVGASILVSLRVHQNQQRRRVRERSRAAAVAQGLEF